jgi:hypothetical protein
MRSGCGNVTRARFTYFASRYRESGLEGTYAAASRSAGAVPPRVSSTVQLLGRSMMRQVLTVPVLEQRHRITEATVP